MLCRWCLWAHNVKALERNILGFAGIAPIHEMLIGSVEGLTNAARQKWVSRLELLGRSAQ